MQIQKINSQQPTRNQNVNFGSSIIKKKDFELVKELFPGKFTELDNYQDAISLLPAELKEKIFQTIIGKGNILLLNARENGRLIKKINQAIPGCNEPFDICAARAEEKGLNKMVEIFARRAKTDMAEIIKKLIQYKKTGEDLCNELA